MTFAGHDDDGGDFASYAGKFVEVFEPGCWLDTGPYGCLGNGPGYAIAARSVRPSSQIVLLLGDGAAGFSMMDVDTMVRHNLPADRWPQGITAFTVIFAAGQIVGPTFTGWLSDVTGSLQNGLAASALLLAVGSVLASRQRALG